MVTFNFATAQRICFGPGRLSELGSLAGGLGRRICLVTGGHSLENNGRLVLLRQMLENGGLEWIRVRFDHEPTVEQVDEATLLARDFGAEAVIAIGGGSVMDGAKAVAALLANGGRTLDYLEGVGAGKMLSHASRPLIAIPTTAGTGSEATRNAVIGNEERTFKKSMRADGMLPTIALVDPELTYDCPPPITAASGMDALTQLIEAFTSRQSNPIIDTLAGLGLGLAGRLPRLVEHPHDHSVREAMALASLLGGMTLANVGLGAVHGLASPLGAFYNLPHGVICAALLPAVVAVNAEKAHARGNDGLLEKYCTAAIQIVRSHESGSTDTEPLYLELIDHLSEHNNMLAVTLALSRYLRGLNEHLGLKGLRAHGLRADDLPRIIAGARGNSMKTNPVDLSDADLLRILEESME